MIRHGAPSDSHEFFVLIICVGYSHLSLYYYNQLNSVLLDFPFQVQALSLSLSLTVQSLKLRERKWWGQNRTNIVEVFDGVRPNQPKRLAGLTTYIHGRGQTEPFEIYRASSDSGTSVLKNLFSFFYLVRYIFVCGACSLCLLFVRTPIFVPVDIQHASSVDTKRLPGTTQQVILQQRSSTLLLNNSKAESRQQRNAMFIVLDTTGTTFIFYERKEKKQTERVKKKRI